MKISRPITAVPPAMGTRLVAQEVVPVVGAPDAVPKSLVNAAFVNAALVSLRFHKWEIPRLESPTVGSSITGLTTAPGAATAPAPARLQPDAGRTLGLPEDRAETSDQPASAWWKASIKGAVPGVSVSREALHLADITSSTTHAQVVHKLTVVGVPDSMVDQAADRVLKLMQSKGVDALLVGAVAGGGVFAMLGLVQPKMRMRRKILISASFAVVVAVAWFTWGSRPDPYVGTWALDSEQSSFQSMDPPRSAAEVISQRNDGLTIKRRTVLANGQVAETTYTVAPDGRDHSFKNGKTRSSREKNQIEADVQMGGSQSHEEWTLSTDRQQMTVKVTGNKPTGQSYQDLLIYARKKE